MQKKNRLDVEKGKIMWLNRSHKSTGYVIRRILKLVIEIQNPSEGPDLDARGGEGKNILMKMYII